MILIDPLIYYDKDENEVWKPLIYENILYNKYLISNHGNVYDLELGKYIAPRIINSGYEVVHLKTMNGPYKDFLVHRLVANNFVAEKREDQTQVNHKNGVKTCNRDQNLEWNSPKENTRHAFETGLASNNIGENSHFAKFTDEQVEIICQMLSEGHRYKDILIYLDIPVTPNNMDAIGNIYRGIAWKHISCKYEFPEQDQRFRCITREQVELICKCIEDGLSNKEICEYVFDIKVKSSRQCKQKYETIRLIRNHKQFVDISSKYNF